MSIFLGEHQAGPCVGVCQAAESANDAGADSFSLYDISPMITPKLLNGDDDGPIRAANPDLSNRLARTVTDSARLKLTEKVAVALRRAVAEADACFVWSETLADGTQGSRRNFVADAWTTCRQLPDKPLESGRLVDRPASEPEMLVFVGGAGSGEKKSLVIRPLGDLVALVATELSGRAGDHLSAVPLSTGAAPCWQQPAWLLDCLHGAVIGIDPTGTVTAWNNGAERLFDHTAAEMLGKSVAILGADSARPLLDEFSGSDGGEKTVRCRKKSGVVFWVNIAWTVAHDEAGLPVGVVAQLTDASNHLAVKEKLGLYATILERNNEAVVVADASERIISSNAAFSVITGYQENEVLGQSLASFVPRAHDGKLYGTVHAGIAGGEQWRGELQFRRKGGGSFPGRTVIGVVNDAGGKPSNYFLVFSDISETKDAESQIHRLAYYDSLTALPNRTLFQLLFEQALSELQRRRGHGALLHLDLNRFKQVNASFGHSQADAILKEVSRRFSAALREEDFVARLGADEFVIALPNIHRRVYAGYVARKILATVAEPFFLGTHEILLSASVGISIFPEDGADAETLLRNASVARYRAKKCGNNAYVFYSQEMNLRSLEQLKLEGALRRASERGEFQLLFQPQLNLATGRISGAEALLRWHHPESGLIPPAEFIPLAEETGLIESVGDWVINAACTQIRQWRDLQLPDVRIAVNLSARQFTATLPGKIVAIIAQHGIPNDALELEITESMLMHSADSVVAMMRDFGEAGLRLTLDDFGTGYSSLSYLKRFPVDNLKIDQSFVRGVPGDGDDSAIARAIIGMARNLRMSVIAEGVETAAQMEFMRLEGCEEIQGFHFSRPLPPQEFAELLLRTNS